MRATRGQVGRAERWLTFQAASATACFGEFCLLADQHELFAQPWFEIGSDGAALLLPDRASLLDAAAADNLSSEPCS